MWTTERVHRDREYAQSTEFGQLILAGATVVALGAGLVPSTVLYLDLERTYGLRVVAALGLEARFLAPVRFGDSIRLRMTLTDQRPSRSRPGHRVLTFEDRILRQDDVEAALIVRTVLATESDPDST